jgi:predicted nuclease of predicted toxin-antitoxin system
LRIRFQADADLRVPIIKGMRRRQPSVDFATAHEAGLAGMDDSAVLALAASNSRVLVSHDVNTMPEEFSRFIQEQSSPGVILISQELSYREAIEGLLRVWSSTEAEDRQNVLSFLPR